MRGFITTSCFGYSAMLQCYVSLRQGESTLVVSNTDQHGGTTKFERNSVMRYNLTNRAGNEHSWSMGAGNILIWGDDAVFHFLGLITTLARGMLVCLPSFSVRRVLAMKLVSFPSHSRRLPGLAASRRWINLRVDPGCHRKSQLEILRPTHFSAFFFAVRKALRAIFGRIFVFSNLDVPGTKVTIVVAVVVVVVVVVEHDRLLDRIPQLGDLQAAWLLLHYCAATRANYFLRVLPPHLTEEYASSHDDAVASCLSSLLDLGEAPLPQPSLRAAQLAWRHGSLGLRSARADRHTAHWASWCDLTCHPRPCPRSRRLAPLSP